MCSHRRLSILHYKYYILLLASLLLTLRFAPPIYSQDITPTDLPTATETPPPAATFSETPSPTATVTETPSATPSETATITVIPTETPTALATPSETATLAETPTETPAALLSETPTETATMTPTVVPPDLTLLLSDDFSEGYPTQWVFGAGTWVAPGGNDYALISYNDDRLAPLLEGAFFNVAAEARFLVEYGAAQIAVRSTQSGHYAARLWSSGQVELYRAGTLIASAMSTTAGWHTLRLSAIAGDVRVSLDGVEVMTWQDASPLPAGGILLSGGQPGQSGFWMDDVRLWAEAGDIQPPMAEFSSFSESSLMGLLSAAGDQVVFAQRNLPSRYIIYAMNVDGTNLRALTADTYNSVDPAVSPDGTRIAFASDRDTPSQYQIYVMNSDGSNMQRVTTVRGFAPSWSPDGSQLTFDSFADGDSEIFAMNADGTNLRQLTNNTTQDVAPRWSPTGSQIAYSSLYRPDEFSAFWRVMVMTGTGANPTYLTDATSNARSPDWSHTGTSIAYQQQAGTVVCCGGAARPYFDIFKMNPDGSDKTNLTQTVSALVNGFEQLVDEGLPVWSSDDGQIAYLRDIAFTEPETWAMNNDGSGQAKLTSVPNGAKVGDWEVLQTPVVPTATFTPTATPTMVPAPGYTCNAEITTLGVPPAQAYVRSGPGAQFEPPIATAQDGTPVTIIGQNMAGNVLWYWIVGYDTNNPTWAGWVVHYLLSLDLSCVTANIPIINELGQTATPTFTPSPTVTLTPSATHNPQITATPTRGAAPEAIPFNNQAHVFGLPPLFNTYPYDTADAYGRIQPPGYNIYGLNIQGIGPTSYAYEFRNNLYEDTSGIHTGLDFGLGNIWIHHTVEAVCDGIIIPSRNGAFNGTLQNGKGISLRCFMDSLDSDRADPDGDGQPNLSNVVVVYDHTEDARLVDLYQVVRVGDPLGRTGIAEGNDYDHLHLEVFLARGYYRNLGDHAVLLNPLVMFSGQIVNNFMSYHTILTYHPIPYDIPYDEEEDTITVTGIDEGQLDSWSVGGNNQDRAGRNAVPSGNFWAVQVTAMPQTPMPPNMVEWPVSMYVLDQNDQPLASWELTNYVFTLYGNDPYVAPNCVLVGNSIDQAQCDYISSR